ncbi:MAG TPA: 2-dehydropantoate 2-reductase [Solirubrobacteraceae bacterium]|nr:2-dehydropantoate 2-reductase [Solirubrobacteraceae bacterium]
MSARGRRVVVVGAGALGTVYGAGLARGGAAVQLLARRPHAEAIQAAGGVEIRGVDGTWRAGLTADWRPDRIEPADTVVVMTKSHDTARALAELPHLVDAVEVAASFQNGIEKDRLLAEWCGGDRVVGGMSMVGATLDAPGIVSHTLPGATYTGELPAGESPRVRALGAALEAGGLRAVVTDQILSVEWSKLIHAGPSMTMTAVPQLPFHRALQDPGLADLYVHLLREGADVAAAGSETVEFLDLPGMFPVRSYLAAPHEHAVEMVRERGRQMEAAGSTNVITSMLRDLQTGRRLELDAVHSFLVAEGDRLGVPVPYNRTCLELLLALDSSRSGGAAQAVS